MKFVKFLVLIMVLPISENTDGRTDDKIQGGYNITDIKNWPFVGYYSVLIDPQVECSCTGILVNQFSAITAGHCVLEDPEQTPIRLLPLDKFKPTIVMGVANYKSVNDRFYQKRAIKELFIHPKAEYNQSPPIEDRWDIGAMKWEEKVILNEKIQLVPLIPEALNPFVVFLDIIKQKSECELAGWGELEVHWSNPQKVVPWPDTLQGLRIVLTSDYECCRAHFMYNFGRCMQRLGVPFSGLYCHFRHSQFTSVAEGDSGSPIYCSYKGKKYVVGMNVAGLHARDNRTVEVHNPSFYAIDMALRPFIKNITGDPGGMSNRSEIKSFGIHFSIQILALSLIPFFYNKFKFF